MALRLHLALGRVTVLSLVVGEVDEDGPGVEIVHTDPARVTGFAVEER